MRRSHKRDRKTTIPDCVMVVEDDAVLALSIEQTLRDAGAKNVVCFAAAADAVDFLRANDPGAIVIDVHLADSSDGYALAEIVSLLGPKKPQIVFSTGAPNDIPDDVARLGVVLEKPYNPAELVDAIGAKPKGVLARLMK